MAEEMLSIADSIGDELKSYMTETGQTKVIIGEYKLSYSDCVRRDLDKKGLNLKKLIFTPNTSKKQATRLLGFLKTKKHLIKR